MLRFYTDAQIQSFFQRTGQRAAELDQRAKGVISEEKRKLVLETARTAKNERQINILIRQNNQDIQNEILQLQNEGVFDQLRIRYEPISPEALQTRLANIIETHHLFVWVANDVGPREIANVFEARHFVDNQFQIVREQLNNFNNYLNTVQVRLNLIAGLKLFQFYLNRRLYMNSVVQTTYEEATNMHGGPEGPASIISLFLGHTPVLTDFRRNVLRGGGQYKLKMKGGSSYENAQRMPSYSLSLTSTESEFELPRTRSDSDATGVIGYESEVEHQSSIGTVPIEAYEEAYLAEMEAEAAAAAEDDHENAFLMPEDVYEYFDIINETLPPPPVQREYRNVEEDTSSKMNGGFKKSKTKR